MLMLKKKKKKSKKVKQASEGGSSDAASGSSNSTAEASGASSSGAGAATAKSDGKKSIFGVGGAKKGSKKKGMKPAVLRMQKDISELDSGKVATISWANKDDLQRMTVTIKPDTGYWRGGTYVFQIAVPDMYPHSAPKVTCTVQIYHPNIDMEGNVCLNILREDWKPVLDINAVIYGLIYLFYEPNPNDPLNLEAAKVLRENPRAFKSNVDKSMRGGSLRIGSSVYSFDRFI